MLRRYFLAHWLHLATILCSFMAHCFQPHSDINLKLGFLANKENLLQIRESIVML